MYIHVRGYVRVWVGGCLCAVCVGMHGCVWKSAEVCVLDEFSKALHDRIGSRSNDDLDHILGKKDRNWLNF